MKTLAKSQQEIITSLPIDSVDKWYLGLVLLGAKPSAWICLLPDFDEADSVKLLKQALDELDLIYKIECRKVDQGGGKFYQKVDFLIGSDGMAVNKLAEAVEKEDDYQIGVCLGYPETAAKAYLNRDFVSKNYIRRQLVDSKLLDFVEFKLSFNHWQQELKVVKSWIDQLRQNLPVVYQEIMSDCKDKRAEPKIVNSRSNKTIKQAYKLANSSRERKKTGLTIFDGVSFVKDYFDRNDDYQSIMVSQAVYQQEKDFLGYFERVIIASDDLIDYISPVKTSSGMLLIVRMSEYALRPSLDAKTILLERIQDSGNLGSIIRSAVAFGIDQIVLSSNSASPYSPEVIRASAGTVFNVRIFQNVDLVDFVKKYDFDYVVTTPHTEVEISRLGLRNPAFVFGNEGRGVSDELADLVKNRVKIKQSNRVESLNLAASVAICLHRSYE